MKMKTQPVRIGLAGLSHDHVHWWFRRPARDDVQVVGIWEPNAALVQRYASQYGLDPRLMFSDLNTMLDQTRPAAVMAFGPIYDHPAVVAACAPRGIHVMVEKPLAVSLEHALAMKALAEGHHIHVLTNYETTWYASTARLYPMLHTERLIGDLRKVVVHDGHWGPQEIGCSAEFLAWLTDPIQNGGGAVMDFGCYGANLITWLLDGASPLAVTAVTQRIKPDIYPRVDDEATIILTYPTMQGIIQASWNWPVDRKDIEVYGQTGYVYAVDKGTLRLRTGPKQPEQSLTLEPGAAPFEDGFAYLAVVVRGQVAVRDTDLSALANNLIVMQILDAARESARTGRTVELNTTPA
jgi:predicted dehydrogenase